MAEAAPSRDPELSDPYRSFRYRLRIDGCTVAGFIKISTPAGDGIEGTHFGEGIPNGCALTLERGLALSRDLERWARDGAADGGGALGSTADGSDAPFASVSMDVMGPHGGVQATYRLARARVSSYQTLPGLDSDIVDAIAIECVTLEHEGWEREPIATSPPAS